MSACSYQPPPRRHQSLSTGCRLSRVVSVSSVLRKDSTQKPLRRSVCSVLKLRRHGSHGEPRLGRGLTALWFLVSQLALAALQHYHVSETVRDQSGTAISGAEIAPKSGTFTAQRVTDSEGRFEFADVPAEPGTIAVKAEGFGPVEQKWSAPGGEVKPLDIVLQPAPQFQRVSVTATRTEVRLGETPASVLVLSSIDL